MLRAISAATILAGGLALTASRAPAQDTRLWKSVGKWDISIDPSIGNGCYAVGTWNGGTVLRIGLNPSHDNFYFLLGNAKWSSLQNDATYDIKIQFGSRAPWEVSAIGLQLAPGEITYLHAQSSKKDFIREFQRALNMRISYNGREIDNLKLAGSRKAWEAVEACQQEMDTRGLPGDDPFATSGAAAETATRSGRKTEDPFAE